VRENDNLAVSGLFDETGSDCLTVNVVERRHWVIEDNSRIPPRRDQLREKRCQRDTPMLAFAENFPDRLGSLLHESDLKI
jgi:hypothetical protein